MNTKMDNHTLNTFAANLCSQIGSDVLDHLSIEESDIYNPSPEEFVEMNRLLEEINQLSKDKVHTNSYNIPNHFRLVTCCDIQTPKLYLEKKALDYLLKELKGYENDEHREHFKNLEEIVYLKEDPSSQTGCSLHFRFQRFTTSSSGLT